jgi:hypothetical protein
MKVSAEMQVAARKKKSPIREHFTVWLLAPLEPLQCFPQKPTRNSSVQAEFCLTLYYDGILKEGM